MVLLSWDFFFSLLQEAENLGGRSCKMASFSLSRSSSQGFWNSLARLNISFLRKHWAQERGNSLTWYLCAKINKNLRGSEHFKRLGKHTLRGWLTFPRMFKHPHFFFIQKYQLEIKSLPWHNSTVITSKQRNAACAQDHIWLTADTVSFPQSWSPVLTVICVAPTGCLVLSKTSASWKWDLAESQSSLVQPGNKSIQAVKIIYSFIYWILSNR